MLLLSTNEEMASDSLTYPSSNIKKEEQHLSNVYLISQRGLSTFTLFFEKTAQNTNAANMKTQLVIFCMYLHFSWLYLCLGPFCDGSDGSGKDVAPEGLRGSVGFQTSWTSKGFFCDAKNIQVERICDLEIKLHCLKKIEVIRREFLRLPPPYLMINNMCLPTCFRRQTVCPQLQVLSLLFHQTHNLSTKGHHCCNSFFCL